MHKTAINTKSHNDCAKFQSELHFLKDKRQNALASEESQELIFEAKDRVKCATEKGILKVLHWLKRNWI